MKKPYLIPAVPTDEHVKFVAENVREPDRAEIWASSRLTPYDAITEGLAHSNRSLTALADGVPVLIAGCVKTCLLTRHGVPWMIATSEIDRHASSFLLQAREHMFNLMDDCTQLWNYVDARNVRSIQWLKWMGFTVESETIPYGYDQLPFHKFTMDRTNNV